MALIMLVACIASEAVCLGAHILMTVHRHK